MQQQNHFINFCRHSLFRLHFFCSVLYPTLWKVAFLFGEFLPPLLSPSQVTLLNKTIGNSSQRTETLTASWNLQRVKSGLPGLYLKYGTQKRPVNHLHFQNAQGWTRLNRRCYLQQKLEAGWRSRSHGLGNGKIWLGVSHRGADVINKCSPCCSTLQNTSTAEK